jgi:glycosidase
VDGFRLDVAGEIPMGFWRDYRKEVRSVNPEAYLVGEIWWLEWPDKLLGPKIFLGGDQFDAIMNYRWFRVARGFFGQAEPVLTPSEFVRWIKGINKGISTDNIQAMMNVASSHDTPRLSTSLYNKTMDKYKAKLSDNPDYKINKPDEITRKEQLILLIHQFTYTGAPQIWNGEEVGMWGADDPDCRKPLVWDDIVYRDEVANYDPARSRSADKVYPDTVLLSFYTKLAKMRRENPVLVYGDLKFLVADDEKMILAYRRKFKTNEIIVVFNRSDKTQSVKIPALKRGEYRNILSADGVSFENEKSGDLVLEPLSAVVLKKE